ncbi:AraC family transcriptional regulator, regulatory protein of adaptative response / methylated-DNA-[protein]-cysteine methyltransferase [Pseudomonas indica]|uniref:AraC family transcriptional regulator, regulatory protein of adaptative response / methylated-DNA-[protein]-cysteine methyltransferase n=1 Tax=Pseudomonas indica TaxID=137658 RepID=A0A1G9NBT1_9PSED|nr:AraC family transcriptional regulator, regulatory protein of adaptative response / methylated-DNA-[protein]-cysteine methyltransferase [Pseudomonas indica]
MPTLLAERREPGRTDGCPGRRRLPSAGTDVNAAHPGTTGGANRPVTVASGARLQGAYRPDPEAWADARRRARLEAELPQAPSVLAAALEAGYSGTRALYERPGALSPAQQRRQGAGEALRYAIAPCPLGLLLLAASEKGVCALLFGDDEASLEDDLRHRFAAARLQRDDAGLGDWLNSVVAQLEEPERAARLPLDLRGTAFQQRVWRALTQIPSGETRRYGELAASLGTHARAIARACASNPVGLLVPCHRVVGGDGARLGYRWGAQRKAALLDGERAVLHEPEPEAG